MQAKTRALAFAGPIRTLDPHLVEELEGIAAGSGFPLAEILALNCRTELLPPGVQA